MLIYNRTSVARSLMARFHGCFEVVFESPWKNTMAADLGLFKLMFLYILTMVGCVYSLESPRRGDSNENTLHTFLLKNIEIIPIMPPDLALWLTLISSNYPCLEQICIVPEVFEPLKLYYR